MKGFQIITTDAGVHAVAVGDNGEKVWTTEVYVDQRDAQAAVGFMAELFIGEDEVDFDVAWSTRFVTFSYDTGKGYIDNIAVPIEYRDQRIPK